jgi:hypothetical protein
MEEYDRRFSWDKKEYKDPLPLPPQLIAEDRESDDNVFGTIQEQA